MFKNRILKFGAKIKSINIQPMKTKLKKQYDSPRVKVLEIKFEGIVCGTGDNQQVGGNYGSNTPIDETNIDDD